MKSFSLVSRFAKFALVGFLVAAAAAPAAVVQANEAASFGQAIAVQHRPVCDRAAGPSLQMSCNARIVVDPAGKPQTANGPVGLTPQQMRAAYNLGNGKVTTNRTLAVVAAYDNPNIFNDLKTYSNQFGLTQLANCPVSTGTTARPCFQKVDQNGGSVYPVANAGWAMEIAMDVQVAHAICDNCNILLVEAASNSYANLFAAIDQAALMGAQVISNSYSSSEWSGQTAYDPLLNRPGIGIVFSSGDAGYGPQYPAASPYVTAVGGTTLTMNGTSYVSETAWSGSGSGCSLYSAKPAFQTDSACGTRTIVDVAAAADPSNGAAVYNSNRLQGVKGGWFQVGGTSLAAPIVAGVYALAGVPGASAANSLPYTHTTGLRDITSGSNGSCGSYLCTAQNGFDGPTGLGTPNGLSAF